MATITLNIPNISCGHCVAAIKRELGGIDGVSRVEGTPEEKSITVEWDAPADLQKIESTLSEINYPAVDSPLDD
jgi:copper chaperone CopZ